MTAELSLIFLATSLHTGLLRSQAPWVLSFCQSYQLRCLGGDYHLSARVFPLRLYSTFLLGNFKSILVSVFNQKYDKTINLSWTHPAHYTLAFKLMCSITYVLLYNLLLSIHLILGTTLWGRYYWPHFSNGKTEAQKVIFPVKSSKQVCEFYLQHYYWLTNPPLGIRCHYEASKEPTSDWSYMCAPWGSRNSVYWFTKLIFCLNEW